jgi:hypothetical protein
MGGRRAGAHPFAERDIPSMLRDLALFCINTTEFHFSLRTSRTLKVFRKIQEGDLFSRDKGLEAWEVLFFTLVWSVRTSRFPINNRWSASMMQTQAKACGYIAN